MNVRILMVIGMILVGLANTGCSTARAQAEHCSSEAQFVRAMIGPSVTLDKLPTIPAEYDRAMQWAAKGKHVLVCWVTEPGKNTYDLEFRRKPNGRWVGNHRFGTLPGTYFTFIGVPGNRTHYFLIRTAVRIDNHLALDVWHKLI